MYKIFIIIDQTDKIIIIILLIFTFVWPTCFLADMKVHLMD